LECPITGLEISNNGTTLKGSYETEKLGLTGYSIYKKRKDL
jgi:hypothetical protein